MVALRNVRKLEWVYLGNHKKGFPDYQMTKKKRVMRCSNDNDSKKLKQTRQTVLPVETLRFSF